MTQNPQDPGMFVLYQRRRPKIRMNWTWAGLSAAGVCAATLVAVAGFGSSHGTTRFTDAGATVSAAPVASPTTAPAPLSPPVVTPTRTPTRRPGPAVTTTAPRTIRHRNPTVALPKHRQAPEPQCDPGQDDIYQAQADVQQAEDERTELRMTGDAGDGDIAVADYRVAMYERALSDVYACTPGQDHHDLDVQEAQAYLALARQHYREAMADPGYSQGDRMEARAEMTRWTRRLVELQS